MDGNRLLFYFDDDGLIDAGNTMIYLTAMS